MIRREVFDKLIVAYPHLHYQNSLKFFSPDYDPYFYSFFDTMHDPETNRYLSEDYTFCPALAANRRKNLDRPENKINPRRQLYF